MSKTHKDMGRRGLAVLLSAAAVVAIILAGGSADTVAAQIKIKKSEPTPAPAPEPTPESGEIKNLDVKPPPPLVGIKIGGGGGQSSGNNKSATPPAKPAAKPNESKDSVGEPAEIFKWVLTQPLQPQTFAWQAGAPPTLMPKVETHICLLTEVSGKFQGYGEAAQIRAVKNSDGQMWWQLAVTNQTDGGTVLAGARCIARDQRGSFFTG